MGRSTCSVATSIPLSASLSTFWVVRDNLRTTACASFAVRIDYRHLSTNSSGPRPSEELLIRCSMIGCRGRDAFEVEAFGSKRTPLGSRDTPTECAAQTAANRSGCGCLEPANHSECECLEPPRNVGEFGCLEPPAASTANRHRTGSREAPSTKFSEWCRRNNQGRDS
jgi:hypothetical protein